jgi:hypothetical protein
MSLAFRGCRWAVAAAAVSSVVLLPSPLGPGIWMCEAQQTVWPSAAPLPFNGNVTPCTETDEHYLAYEQCLEDHVDENGTSTITTAQCEECVARFDPGIVNWTCVQWHQLYCSVEAECSAFCPCLAEDRAAMGCTLPACRDVGADGGCATDGPCEPFLDCSNATNSTTATNATGDNHTACTSSAPSRAVCFARNGWPPYLLAAYFASWVSGRWLSVAWL